MQWKHIEPDRARRVRRQDRLQVNFPANAAVPNQNMGDFQKSFRVLRCWLSWSREQGRFFQREFFLKCFEKIRAPASKLRLQETMPDFRHQNFPALRRRYLTGNVAN